MISRWFTREIRDGQLFPSMPIYWTSSQFPSSFQLSRHILIINRFERFPWNVTSRKCNHSFQYSSSVSISSFIFPSPERGGIVFFRRDFFPRSSFSTFENIKVVSFNETWSKFDRISHSVSLTLRVVILTFSFFFFFGLVASFRCTWNNISFSREKNIFLLGWVVIVAILSLEYYSL